LDAGQGFEDAASAGAALQPVQTRMPTLALLRLVAGLVAPNADRLWDSSAELPPPGFSGADFPVQISPGQSVIRMPTLESAS
jgi:hypothetical protein